MGYDTPLEQYVKEMDFRHRNKSYDDIYYNLALSVDTKKFTNLFLMDIKHRAEFGLNIIASVTGMQGSGKSLFGIQLCRSCSHYFGVPFELKKHLYIDKDLINDDIRTVSNNTTLMYDEQERKSAGYGSTNTSLELRDYEDICRYTQKNLINIAPVLYEHGHYFIFRQYQSAPDRIRNKVCSDCPLLVKCRRAGYNTLCDELSDAEKKRIGLIKKFEFYEKDGYPKTLSYLLETIRYSDGNWIPRGVVSFPMPPPEIAKEYDEVKKMNIFNYEARQTKSWDKKMEEVRNFVDKYEDKLIYKSKSGTKIKPKKTIKVLFLSEYGDRRFTIDQTELMVEAINMELESRI